MEGIGSEVSHKIRAAIKAKLIELGAYVDDELPDYIMVMVANKRTRAQMDEDLQLFLSSNTKIFTSWLHTVLQKLQEVTVATFENKKDSNKRSTKRKKSELSDGRSRKSSEETIEKVKKHSKKHKETKKSKKNKHKSKEKTKPKKSDKEESKEKSEKEYEKKTSQNKNSKSKKIELNEAVGRAILGDLKKNKKLCCDKELSKSSSVTDDESPLNGKSAKENGNDGNKAGDEVLNVTIASKALGGNIDSNRKSKEVIEDEFNIEPLKPMEKDIEMETSKDEESKLSVKSEEVEPEIQVEKTISAPTEELLKQHDKIQSEKFEGESKVEEQTKPKSDSEESLSPEEIRKQLLLSRAKKKLEESKKAERMRSNSPDVLILEETSGEIGGRQKDLFLASSRQPDARSPRSTCSGFRELSRTESPRRSRHQSSVFSERSHSPERSPCRRGVVPEYKSKTEVKSWNEEKKKISLGKNEKEGEKRKNVIKISESLQMEKNLGIKKESKEITRKRPVSSRVVTITGPEAPEIPSIVKVKPREFIAKDKQANKALILKAVADAEKSIATVQARPEVEPEPKKEALYTKTLREKRYEKLAVTLSNIRRSPNSRRLEKRVSVDSEKSEKKRDSSELSDGVRIKSDFSKKVSKSEDQFISSKTTVMEKNDKYIRCWLEGVEKAVKDDEMVNPSEMDDLVDATLTDNENDLLEKEDDQKRKRKASDPSADASSKALKLTEKDIANLRVFPNSEAKEEGPQIVVTLDGLDSKAIKELIIKNKESTGKPLLSFKSKNSGASTEKLPPSDSRKLGLEKMSDRFGRLNKTNEDKLGRGDKKHPETEKKKDYATSESKNRQLIAQLSEKFGKVDREFESRKRKRLDDGRRYSCEMRRSEKEDSERNGRYKKSERKYFREGGFGLYRRS